MDRTIHDRSVNGIFLLCRSRSLAILGALVFGSYAFAEVPCAHLQSYEEAVGSSEAIFEGRVVKENPTAMAAKGGTSLGYSDFRFEVTKSWKLVDRKFVWIRVPSRISNDCGVVSVGKEYLVFANRLNDLLYISPQSRTLAREISGADIERLGAELIEIEDGEFRMYSTTITTIVVLAISILFLAGVLVLVYRRRFPATLFSFFLLGVILGVGASCGPAKEAAQMRFALACARGDLDVVKDSVDGGHRVDINNVNGMIGPCIDSAAYGGHDDVIAYLIGKRADVNVKGEKGNTPLISAVLGNHKETVELLLKNGADASIVMPNDKGELTGITALTVARMKGNREIIQMLEEAGDLK